MAAYLVNVCVKSEKSFYVHPSKTRADIATLLLAIWLRYDQLHDPCRPMKNFNLRTPLLVYVGQELHVFLDKLLLYFLKTCSCPSNCIYC